MFFVIVAFVMLVLAGFVLAKRRRATSAAPKPGLGVSVHDQYLQMVANETLDERVERLKSGL
jgi:hypothetical protein